MHDLSLSDGIEITLEQLLDAKEQRALRQKQWLAEINSPLLSLTLNIPGAIKNSSAARFLLGQATTEAIHICQNQNWWIQKQENDIQDTGLELLMTIEAPIDILKSAFVILENTHPLGRLWDFDIIDGNGIPVSRKNYNQPARKCLLCQEEAHICRRNQKHSLGELIKKIETIIHAFYPEKNA